MEQHELRRVLDQVKPSSEQEEAMLARLLNQERKEHPVKKFRNTAAVLAAAVMLLLTCAFTFATGLDQRLLDYFGLGEDSEPLLASVALPLDIQVSDHDSSLHVRQVLKDRYSVMVLMDFTLPEGTRLEKDAYNGFDFLAAQPCFVDENGDQVVGAHISHCSWETLGDGEPLDNHLTMLLSVFYFFQDGVDELDISRLWLPAQNFESYASGERVLVHSGDWSCEIPLPQQDSGWTQPLNQVIWQGNAQNASVCDLYLSPMSLRLTLERGINSESLSDEELYQEWLSLIHSQDIILTTKDGQAVSLTEIDGAIGEEYQWRIYRLTEITDPAQFNGGTITFTLKGGQTTVLPLDGLIPADS